MPNDGAANDELDSAEVVIKDVGTFTKRRLGDRAWDVSMPFPSSRSGAKSKQKEPDSDVPISQINFCSDGYLSLTISCGAERETVTRWRGGRHLKSSTADFAARLYSGSCFRLGRKTNKKEKK